MAVGPPRIRDPGQIPVVGVDDHLPALPASALTPEALQRRFAEARTWVPELHGDGGRFPPGHEPMAASVLMPLVPRGDAVQVLLTRRADHLRDHAGQVSFPGGRVDPSDVNAVDTALREAHEEVGLRRDRVQVLGALNPYATVTSYVVTPIVGLVAPPFELALDASEVAEAFEVPLQFLMTPAHHRRHVIAIDGVQRQFLSMPWRGLDAQGNPREYFIWGATAAMLRNLYHFLR